MHFQFFGLKFSDSMQNLISSVCFIGLKNGNSGGYHLSIGDEKSKLWCLFFISNSLATFCRKRSMGTAHQFTMRTSYCLGPPNPIKNLAHWMGLLGQPLSRNHVFKIFYRKKFLLIVIILYKNIKKVKIVLDVICLESLFNN